MTPSSVVFDSMHPASCGPNPRTSVRTTDPITETHHRRRHRHRAAGTMAVMSDTGVLAESGISAREAEVLAALGEHLTNAEIGAKLFISVRTVESHVSSLLRKLGATDRRELGGLPTR